MCSLEFVVDALEKLVAFACGGGERARHRLSEDPISRWKVVAQRLVIRPDGGRWVDDSMIVSLLMILLLLFLFGRPRLARALTQREAVAGVFLTLTFLLAGERFLLTIADKTE